MAITLEAFFLNPNFYPLQTLMENFKILLIWNVQTVFVSRICPVTHLKDIEKFHLPLKIYKI